MNKFDDFDLDLTVEENATDNIQPLVSSRYACTPGSCWELVCFTTTK